MTNRSIQIPHDEKKRCFGGVPGKEFYAEYHDHEWGIPVHEDRHLFEMLILEGAQAGLSWETILKRRKGYRAAFHNFDPTKVASMSNHELDALLHNQEIIRNRLKIYAARQNAKVFLTIQQEFGSFDRYVWNFVTLSPIINHWQSLKDVQGNCKKNHLTLTPRILRRYSGLHPASFLLLGTPNFSDVSALSNPRAIFFTNEKFSAA